MVFTLDELTGALVVSHRLVVSSRDFPGELYALKSLFLLYNSQLYVHKLNDKRTLSVNLYLIYFCISDKMKSILNFISS